MRIANNLKKTLITAITFGTALTACKPEPIPAPESQKKRTITIRTIADMQKEMGAAARGSDSTFIVTIANHLGSELDELQVVGNWKEMDDGATNLTTKYNGFGIYPNKADQELGFDKWKNDTKSHDLFANPVTGDRFIVTVADYQKFVSAGEPDVAVPTKTIELTAADAADFSAAIKRIVAQNPTEAINVHVPFDIDVKDESVLKLLRSLHVDNPSAKIYVTDANGNPADLDIAKIWTNTWDLRPGGNARWILASGAGTQIFQADSSSSGTIVIPDAAENKVNLTIPDGKQDFKVVRLDVLPIRHRLMYGSFHINAHEIAFYIPPEIGINLQSENGYDGSARNANSWTVANYLRSHSVVLDREYYLGDWYLVYGETDVWMRSVIYYNSQTWAADPRTAGKQPYGADIYINPRNKDVTRAATGTRSVAKYKPMQNTR